MPFFINCLSFPIWYYISTLNYDTLTDIGLYVEDGAKISYFQTVSALEFFNYSTIGPFYCAKRF